MTQWILIIFIGSELWIPQAAFDTEDECYAAIHRYIGDDSKMRATCLPGVIEENKPRKRNKRHG